MIRMGPQSGRARDGHSRKAGEELEDSEAAGLAADWTVLPEPLRHGMVRLAAHQHRERESSGAASVPPAAVAALWRPWRRLRLA